MVGYEHDVLTVVETGKAEQSWPDEAVLEFARADGRDVLTLNRKHFIRLHQQNPEHTGVICCTLDADFAGQAGRIHAAISACANLKGRLLRVNRPPSPGTAG